MDDLRLTVLWYIWDLADSIDKALMAWHGTPQGTVHNSNSSKGTKHIYCQRSRTMVRESGLTDHQLRTGFRGRDHQAINTRPCVQLIFDDDQVRRSSRGKTDILAQGWVHIEDGWDKN
jgi:hypothetical protein